MSKQYDLVVIGAGSGGLVSAEVAARFGAKVALVEAQASLGGECLHSGCVPSKALIKAARTAYAAQNGAKYGIIAKPTVDFAKVMKHVKSSIATIEKRSDNDAHYIELGADMFHGQAEFIDAHTISVGKDQLTFKKCIIATGSRPLVPNVPGLAKTSYLTNETIFELTTLPTSLTVIGGGPISVELGQAFAMLGTEVTLLAREDRLLPREEPAASAALLREFEKMGITVLFGVELKSTSGTIGNIEVSIVQAGRKQTITSTHLLIATGSVPNTPGKPELAGVSLTYRGAIKVNVNLQSSAGHIYAIGDCNGGMQFTHVAAAQATMAVQNALLFGSRKNGLAMPVWATFTTPEIAHLGATEEQLRTAKTTYTSYNVSYDEIDKAVAEGESGFIQVLVGKKGAILGATIVGENAAELTSQIVFAARNKLSFKQLGNTLQAYPTYGLGVKELSSRTEFTKLLGGPIGKIIRRFI